MGKYKKFVNVSNVQSGIYIRCSYCGYIARGKNGVRLHSKYAHGINEPRNINSYCSDCNKKVEDIHRHMIKCHHI